MRHPHLIAFLVAFSIGRGAGACELNDCDPRFNDVTVDAAAVGADPVKVSLGKNLPLDGRLGVSARDDRGGVAWRVVPLQVE